MENQVKGEFSVSMCVYAGDRVEWFQTAVNSILNQTILPTEIVLVVDGPVSADLSDAIRAFEKLECFKVLWLPENQGHGNARRIGLQNCSCDLIALMDADDISVNDRFEQQLLAFQEDSSLSLVGGNISEFIGNEDNIVGYRIVPQEQDEITEYLKKRCPFNQVSVMFRKGDVESAGGYIDWYCEEDYYLWIRMYLAGMKFKNIPKVLVKVRVGKEMYARRGGLAYFKSEAKLQKYMKKEKVIGSWTYFSNVSKRFVLQVLLPNRIRSWVFKRFARSKLEKE